MMALIFKKDALIEVKIQDITVKLKPLSYSDKMEVQKHLGNMKDINGMMKAAYDAIALSLKEIHGLEYGDGSPYVLKIQNDKIVEDCMDELLNASFASELNAVCSAMLNGISSDKILDANTGLPIEGIEIVLPGKK